MLFADLLLAGSLVVVPPEPIYAHKPDSICISDTMGTTLQIFRWRYNDKNWISSISYYSSLSGSTVEINVQYTWNADTLTAGYSDNDVFMSDRGKYLFDKDGKVVKWFEYSNDTLYFAHSLYYNKFNMPEKTIHCNYYPDQMACGDSMVYDYNAAGALVAYTQYYNSGKIWGRNEIASDSLNRPEKMFFFGNHQDDLVRMDMVAAFFYPPQSTGIAAAPVSRPPAAGVRYANGELTLSGFDGVTRFRVTDLQGRSLTARRLKNGGGRAVITLDRAPSGMCVLWVASPSGDRTFLFNKSCGAAAGPLTR